MWTMTLLAVSLSVALDGQSSVQRLFENDLVNTYDLTIQPGTVEQGFHEHKIPYVYVALSGGTARIRFPNGTSEIISYKIGETRWGPVERHAVDNIGETALRFVIADIKLPATQH